MPQNEITRPLELYILCFLICPLFSHGNNVHRIYTCVLVSRSLSLLFILLFLFTSLFNSYSIPTKLNATKAM